MTGLDIYMDRIMQKKTNLDIFEQKHHRAHSPEPGGHVEYFMATAGMVPALISVARAAAKLLGEGQNYHSESYPYEQLKMQLHLALRQVEEG